MSAEDVEQTRDGETISVADIKSHAALTYDDLGLFTPAVAKLQAWTTGSSSVDCLELDLMVGGRPSRSMSSTSSR